MRRYIGVCHGVLHKEAMNVAIEQEQERYGHGASKSRGCLTMNQRRGIYARAVQGLGCKRHEFQHERCMRKLGRNAGWDTQSQQRVP